MNEYFNPKTKLEHLFDDQLKSIEIEAVRRKEIILQTMLKSTALTTSEQLNPQTNLIETNTGINIKPNDSEILKFCTTYLSLLPEEELRVLNICELYKQYLYENLEKKDDEGLFENQNCEEYLHWNYKEAVIDCINNPRLDCYDMIQEVCKNLVGFMESEGSNLMSQPDNFDFDSFNQSVVYYSKDKY